VLQRKRIRTLFLETYRKKFNLIVSCPCRYPDIKGEYDILVNELTKYNPEMLDKERLLVISKCDMLDDELTAELKEELDVSLKGVHVYIVCCTTRVDRIERIMENVE
jgi:GTPase involved in cell partitioning and DNA repair